MNQNKIEGGEGEMIRRICFRFNTMAEHMKALRRAERLAGLGWICVSWESYQIVMEKRS